MTCPKCGSKLTDAEARTIRASYHASLRVSHPAGPGRPRQVGNRCPCGKYTLRTAKAKWHKCEPSEAEGAKLPFWMRG